MTTSQNANRSVKYRFYFASLIKINSLQYKEASVTSRPNYYRLTIPQPKPYFYIVTIMPPRLRGSQLARRTLSTLAYDVPPMDLMEPHLATEWKAVMFFQRMQILPTAECTRCYRCDGPVGYSVNYDENKHKDSIPFGCFVMRCRARKCLEGEARWQRTIFADTMLST
jgi:hypothetical protein